MNLELFADLFLFTHAPAALPDQLSPTTHEYSLRLDSPKSILPRIADSTPAVQDASRTRGPLESAPAFGLRQCSGAF